MTSSVRKLYAILAKKQPNFELNFHPEGREKNDWNSLLSKFNELSENHPKLWIFSLLDQEIRDLVRGLKKGSK